MTTLLAVSALVLGMVPPITPEELEVALQAPLDGDKADEVAGRIRAAFPDGMKEAKPLVKGDAVAFVLEAPADLKSPPRVEGMVNHNRGLELVPIGTTGLWARIEHIATDTKFAYSYAVEGKRVGGGVVEMPDWKYPPESSEAEGRAYGKYLPISFRSKVFDNDRTGWVYVPAAYKPDGPPAALMVFQDGDAYKGEKVGTVVDNLIAEGAMPVTILVLLNPGVNDDKSQNRSREYDTLSNAYATFLADEVIPLVAKDYKLREDPAGRAIGGASSGGICAFTVAFERPDLFGRVLSQIGSFTNIRGGHVYPERVRAAGKKPIKVILTDGTNDLINQFGDWWQANNAMYAALGEAGYDASFVKDRGFHAYWTCGKQLPEVLRLLWKD